MTKQSTRRTSKLVLGINTGLAWGCAFYSLYTGQGAAVAGCLALIGGLYGSYVGVGHLDYRRLLSCMTTREENDNFFEDNPYPVEPCGSYGLMGSGDITGTSKETFASRTDKPETHDQPVQGIG